MASLKSISSNFNRKLKQVELGAKFIAAVRALINMRQTETILNTFIVSLIEQIDSTGRVHCSLNINTETGRLSSRRPNLQNQPALDKDIYKTRLAFEASPGKKLIIADYGQLELRVLAIITNCKSMIQAFRQGGDFHSRTAANMFDYIKKDLNNGLILLEKSKNIEENTLPLLKDKYANERKKAKTMNFSVAYGKSAYGFAKDWNCSVEEAERFVELWYSDRPEVRKWQDQIKRLAFEKGYTKTLMDRYRNLTKHFTTNNKKHILHGLRAAINTPIQGGAADIVIAAMVKAKNNKELKELGWKIIHQIHDEVILEGPKDTAEKALAILKEVMEDPLGMQLSVKLEVDAKICDNWYESK
jgi:DNA polymerase-1